MLPAGGFHPPHGQVGAVIGGITGLSKSAVSEMAKDLEENVESFRTRRLEEAGPFTFLAADALVLKVREGGRVVGVHAMVATGVNNDGHREIVGLHLSSAEDSAGWLGFFRDLTPRGLTGVKLGTSDAHADLVAAIGATLPGAAWQRRRTHYSANLMSNTPKASWPWVKTMLHTIYDQPDANAVHAQFDRVIDTLSHKLPTVADHLETARAVLAEQHNEWAEGRRYLSLDVLARSQAITSTQTEATEDITLQALTA